MKNWLKKKGMSLCGWILTVMSSIVSLAGLMSVKLLFIKTEAEAFSGLDIARSLTNPGNIPIEHMYVILCSTSVAFSVCCWVANTEAITKKSWLSFAIVSAILAFGCQLKVCVDFGSFGLYFFEATMFISFVLSLAGFVLHRKNVNSTACYNGGM